MDSRGAIVATVESSSISACTAGITVSSGKFTELCIRLAEDFNHTLDDWKPMPNDPNLMNLCLVSEGSYEVCSQTAKALKEENAKWFLNIQWQMTGKQFCLQTTFVYSYYGRCTSTATIFLLTFLKPCSMIGYCLFTNPSTCILISCYLF